MYPLSDPHHQVLYRHHNAPGIGVELIFLVLQVLAWHTPGTASYVEFANGFPSRARMQDILGYYMQSDDIRNPLAFPLNAKDLSGLPAALIFAAEKDVLRDEAEAYAAKLLAARSDPLLHAGQLLQCSSNCKQSTLPPIWAPASCLGSCCNEPC